MRGKNIEEQIPKIRQQKNYTLNLIHPLYSIATANYQIQQVHLIRKTVLSTEMDLMQRKANLTRTSQLNENGGFLVNRQAEHFLSHQLHLSVKPLSALLFLIILYLLL